MFITTALALAAPLVVAYPSRPTHPPAYEHNAKGWKSHALIGQGPRQEHSVVALDDKIYVLGGVATSDLGELDTINRVEFYDTTSDSWGIAAPLPKPGNHVNVAAVQGKLYFLGSLSGGLNWTAQADSHVYHTNNDSWTDIAPMPKGTARGSSAVGVQDDTIYLAGGMSYLALVDEASQDSVATVSSYNVKTGEWNGDFPDLPQPRQHVGGAIVEGTFYVLGGREDGISGVADTVYALDLADTAAGWKSRAPMPTARGGLACAAVGHEIFCLGGEGNPDNEHGVFEDVEVYDTRADKWTKLEDMPVPRHGTGAASLGGRVYIPGGGLIEAAGPTGWFDSYGPQ